MSRLRSLALLTVAAGLALSACSKSVSTNDLEDQIGAKFEQLTGQAPDDVTCDDTLPAKKDAKVQCDVTADGETHKVDVTATSVDGNQVNFNIKLADGETPSVSPSESATEPSEEDSASAASGSVSSSELESQINAQLQKQFGKTPDDLTCPTALPAEVDATVQCLLTDGSEKYGVTVTATSVDGSSVNFGFQVADSPMS